MRSCRLSVFAGISIALGCAVGQAQEPLAAYRFNAEPYLPATTNAAGLTASPVSLSSGSFATGEVNVVTGTYFPDEPYIEESAGWTASSPTNAKAFLLTLTPDAGKSITVTGLSFKAYAVGTTGPSAISYDVAGLATGTINATNDLVLTNDFAIAGVTNQAGAVLIKIQGWTNNTRAVSGGGAFRLDDVLVYGVVEAIPTNLQFAGSSATMRESSSYTVTVTKTVSSGSVSAELQLGGTATPGADYTVDTTNVVLDGATTSATVVVTAADDASLEGPESLTLTLANVVGGGTLAPSTFTLTIDDPSVLAVYRFNTEPYLPPTANAAGLTASPVSLSSGSFATGEVNVVTGTYFPDEPYIEESTWTASSQAGAKAFLITLTPQAGKSIAVTGLAFKAYAQGSGPSAISYDVGSLATGTINATNDLVLTNYFAIAGVTDQSGVVQIKIQGWTNNTRVTSGAGAFRLDDVLIYGYVQSTGGGSPTNVRFFASGAVVGEDQGVMNVTVYKTVAEGNVTAEIQLGGSAALGVDYSVDTTNIVLNGATTSQTVVVTITDDPAIEPTETVVLSLVNVSGGTAIAPDAFTLSITNNDLADADGDLMPDSWEQDNFGGSTTNGAAGDPDSDGFSNLAEYIAGTQPTNGLSYLRLTGVTAAAGANVSFFGVTGRLYRLDYSEALLNGSGWIEFTNSIPGTNGLMWVPQGDAATPRGYRVSVQLP